MESRLYKNLGSLTNEGIALSRIRDISLAISAISVPHACVAASIASSPWFDWSSSALSDLGHSLRSRAAPLFNFGLVFGGFLVALYALTSMRERARHSSWTLAGSGFALQLVGTFDEVYGSLHLAASIAFFGSLGLALATYALEVRSRVAATALAIGLLAWAGYLAGVYRAGVAVPELISSLAAAAWIGWDAYSASRHACVS